MQVAKSFVKNLQALLFISILLAGTIVIPAANPNKADALNSKTALIYGDSLVWESRPEMNKAILNYSGWSYSYRGYPGTAPCDWLPNLQTDLDNVQPSIVAIETAGNYTRPCMADENGNQPVRNTKQYYDKYRSDLNTFFATVTASGAKLLFIEAAPMLETAWNKDVEGIYKIAKELGATYPGVSITNAAHNAVAIKGKYTSYMSCLNDETAEMGCINGQIPVRTLSGTQMGIHLCPDGLPPFPYYCLTYSSGERRFAEAIIKKVVKPPQPIKPTLLIPAITVTEGAAVKFKPRLKYPYYKDFTFCYFTTDGTATVAAGDYESATGCFTIPAWSTTAVTVSVQTLADGVPEPLKENFKLNVKGTTTTIQGTTKKATGNIKPNDT